MKTPWIHRTFNPVIGCAHCSPGCDNCYAERSFDHLKNFVKWGSNGERLIASPKNWKAPYAWDAASSTSNDRQRILCSALGDLFERWAGDFRGKVYEDGKFIGNSPYRIDAAGTWYIFNERSKPQRLIEPTRKLTQDDVRSRVFATMRGTPSLTWLILTKRIADAQAALGEAAAHLRNVYAGGSKPSMIDDTAGLAAWLDGWRTGTPPENVWMGISVETLHFAAMRHLYLMQLPARLRFWVVEPLLEWFDPRPLWRDYGKPDWITLGGEVGTRGIVRDTLLNWFDDWVEWCREFGIPLFIKQAGSMPTLDTGNGTRIELNMASDRGDEPGEWPDWMRVQELP